MASDPWADQGTTYAAFAQEQLDHEWERRVAVDGRAFSVLTSSGVLTTLTVTLGLWSLRSGGQVGAARVLGVVTVGLFLLAAVLGILASQSRKYKVLNQDEVTALIMDHWTDHEADARSLAAQYRTFSMASLRAGNNRKADLISVALWLQLAGLITISGAVAIALFR